MVHDPNAAMSSKTVFCFFQSKKFAGVVRQRPCSGTLAHNESNRSGFLYGSGRSITALMTLKSAVLAPIANASVVRAIAVTTRFFHNIRAPNRTSCHKEIIADPQSVSGLLFSDLFITQRHQRIDSRRAMRGDVTSDNGDEHRVCVPSLLVL